MEGGSSSAVAAVVFDSVECSCLLLRSRDGAGNRIRKFMEIGIVHGLWGVWVRFICLRGIGCGFCFRFSGVNFGFTLMLC